MGKLFSEIDERNAEFIRTQRMFFVATAPGGSEGHVNLSPKGLDSFAILDGIEDAAQEIRGGGIGAEGFLQHSDGQRKGPGHPAQPQREVIPGQGGFGHRRVRSGSAHKGPSTGLVSRKRLRI